VHTHWIPSTKCIPYIYIYGMTYSYYLQLHGSSSLQKKTKMLTQRIFFAKNIPTLDTLLLLSSGNFCHSLLLQLLLLLKSYNLKKKLLVLLLLLVVPSPELILVLKHPLYLLCITKQTHPPKHVYDPENSLFLQLRILPLFYLFQLSSLRVPLV